MIRLTLVILLLWIPTKCWGQPTTSKNYSTEVFNPNNNNDNNNNSTSKPDRGFQPISNDNNNIDNITSLDQLLKMSREELATIYGRGTADAFPNGPTVGVPLARGSAPIFMKRFAVLANWVWKGKVFNAEQGSVTNILVAGYEDVHGYLFIGPSITDSLPAIIIDYSPACVPFNRVWDEMRLVGDTVYLGKTYIKLGPDNRTQFLIYFALDSVRWPV